MPAVSAISSQATLSSHTSLRLRGETGERSERSRSATSHGNPALLKGDLKLFDSGGVGTA